MSSATLTRASPMLQQHQSPLFKIAPELRNRVYKMTFECGPESIDLATWFRYKSQAYNIRFLGQGEAAPPSVAVLRACQRVYNESIGMFKTAFEAYWDKNFIFRLRSHDCNAPYISYMPSVFLSHIRNFTLLHNGYLLLSTTMISKLSEGSWQFSVVIDTISDDDSLWQRTLPAHVTSGIASSLEGFLDRRTVSCVLEAFKIVHLYFQEAFFPGLIQRFMIQPPSQASSDQTSPIAIAIARS